ncbi:MAG: hypothetical protein IPK83_06715 [Planctomycetes bacterium]|nr:hypothetical protein [Planctomycetota bacterium]
MMTMCAASFYEPMLPHVIEEVQVSLQSKSGQSGDITATCRRDKGALCIYLEKPDGTPAFKGPRAIPCR